MYVIQIYKFNYRHKEDFAVSEQQAKAIADKEFMRRSVYKVKVWKGKPVPNVVDHVDLIYYLA